MPATSPAAKPRPRAPRQAPTLRRQDLLDVTVRCLAKLGPRGTTGREICRQAGVSHGLLRHYFDNPDNLLLETYQSLCEQFLGRFEERLAAAGDDPTHALDAFCALHFSADWASPDILGAWMAFWSLVRTSAEFRAVSESYNGRLRTLLAGAVAGLATAPGAPSLDDAITILLATNDGLWLDACLARERMPPERAQTLCRAAARSLLGR